MYRSACDCEIDTGSLTPEEVADRIISVFGEAGD
jgi:hypothetical protein